MSSAERPRDRRSHEGAATEGDPPSASVDAPRSRRDLLRAGGAAAVASILGVLGVATSTAARNGEPLRAGGRTTATRPTTIEGRGSTTFQARNPGTGDAVALRGVVPGERGETIGVQGLVASADGTAGQFLASSGGTAVEANATGRNGVALRTRGRLQFTERSGVAPVSGGAEFVIPVSGALGERTIVLATLQDHFPGIHVESAHVLDAEEGLIVVRLNQAVPEPARVGWLVLD